MAGPSIGKFDSMLGTVPPNLRLDLKFVLLLVIMLKTHFSSALECGKVNTSIATVVSFSKIREPSGHLIAFKLLRVSPSTTSADSHTWSGLSSCVMIRYCKNSTSQLVQLSSR